MKDLNFDELIVLDGGGFAYDMGCTWRCIAGYAVGFALNGGPLGAGYAGGVALSGMVRCR